MYTSRYRVLRHRCERETSVIWVFPLWQWPGWINYDVTIVQWGTSLSEYWKGNVAHMKGNMAKMKGNMALTKGNMALRHVRNG